LFPSHDHAGKKWSKENLLIEVAELLGGNGDFFDGNYNDLVKKQYNKEQLATMYILNK
jgi:hypothetical protein